MSGRDITLCAAIEACLTGELFCAERGKIAPAADQRACRKRGPD